MRESFTLGGHLVEPQLNRVVRRDGSVVSIKPKVVDVLVCLAERAGQVVPKDDIFQTVWPEMIRGVLPKRVVGFRNLCR